MENNTPVVFNAETFASNGIKTTREAFKSKISQSAFYRNSMNLIGGDYPSTYAELQAGMVLIMRDNWTDKEWSSVQSIMKKAAVDTGHAKPALERKPESGVYTFPAELVKLTDEDKKAVEQAKADKKAAAKSEDLARIEAAVEERISQSGMVPALVNATAEQAARAAVHCMASGLLPGDLILAILQHYPVTAEHGAAIVAHIGKPAPVRKPKRTVNQTALAEDLQALAVKFNGEQAQAVA